MRSPLILLFLILFCFGYASAEESRFDHRDDRACVDFSNHEQKTSPTAPESLFINGIGLYQRYLSPIAGDRCRMYPSCSTYSIEAIRKHGVFIGLVMTFDRLIHEIGEPARTSMCKHNDEYLFYDPVEANDFWWAEKK